MYINEITNGRKPFYPLSYKLEETPHIVIEPTMECNIQCKACYNRYRQKRKSFEEVCNDIEIAMKKRKLDTISILGGEPTLYPQLKELIKYIKSKKLYCQLLTNGIRFNEQDGFTFLKELKQAGLDRIVLHADSGQSHVHKDITLFCHELFREFEELKIYFGLAVTIYPSNKDVLSDIVKEYKNYKFFEGILATLYRDAKQILSGNDEEEVPIKYIYSSLKENLNLYPTSYLPSSLNINSVGWLIYFYYINVNTDVVFTISNRLSTLFRKLYRKLTGRNFFGMTLNPSLFKPTLLITCIAEILLGGTPFSAFLKLIHNSNKLESIRFHYIVVQRGPYYNKEQNKVEICYHCPDATIRNGKITPVCLADFIAPYSVEVSEEFKKTAETVFIHLGENI